MYWQGSIKNLTDIPDRLFFLLCADQFSSTIVHLKIYIIIPLNDVYNDNTVDNKITG